MRDRHASQTQRADYCRRWLVRVARLLSQHVTDHLVRGSKNPGICDKHLISIGPVVLNSNGAEESAPLHGSWKSGRLEFHAGVAF